jgi:hypothetical protein
MNAVDAPPLHPPLWLFMYMAISMGACTVAPFWNKCFALWGGDVMAQLIIGLIIIGLILKYLYVLVPLVCLALVVFGIAKLIKSGSKTTSNSLTALSLTLPDMHPSHDIENHYETPITLPHNNTASEAVTKVDAECAFCHTLGQHKLLRVTDTTVDLNCRACGKNFFI